ncbi:MAG: pantetheine-phosphate adenylyltransferase [Actinobacteria bacterium]|nr:pantetheine-phosphate adenylyltransferase [Actinomycetota bacterium]
MTVAVYPGSFDPVTNGHLDIIERAAQIFDLVLVVVFRNSEKNPLFTDEERLELLTRAVAHIPNVRVDSSDGLTAQYAREHGARVIVKGLRAVSDFENEMQMAQMNKLLSDIETMFMMTSSQYSFLSSSIVKEIASYGASVDGLVPKVVEERLRVKFAGAGK